MNIIKTLKLADYVTLGNLISGSLSILFTLSHYFTLAALLLIASALFDFLDGRIARLTKTENLLGKYLDSLSDLVSFGLAPAVLGYGLGLQTWYAVVVLVVFVSCGALRLARFMITESKDFEGLPITHTFLYGVLYFLVPFNNYMVLVYLFSSLLMIATFRFKKL
ncbi:CDP-diacylglycerol--serine O-phosphatidyltransferase [Candidatus Woesearchaeota archaeon]|nr:CDP-diacylglycerol--serine O-phosphatidyltransferase [Candidatus Woesearchaeota archaeon]